MNKIVDTLIKAYTNLKDIEDLLNSIELDDSKAKEEVLEAARKKQKKALDDFINLGNG